MVIEKKSTVNWTVLSTVVAFYAYQIEEASKQNDELRKIIGARFGMSTNSVGMKIDINLNYEMLLLQGIKKNNKGSTNLDKYVVKYFHKMPFEELRSLFEEIMNCVYNTDSFSEDTHDFLRVHTLKALPNINVKYRPAVVENTELQGINLGDEKYNFLDKASTNKKISSSNELGNILNICFILKLREENLKQIAESLMMPFEILKSRIDQVGLQIESASPHDLSTLIRLQSSSRLSLKEMLSKLLNEQVIIPLENVDYVHHAIYLKGGISTLKNVHEYIFQNHPDILFGYDHPTAPLNFAITDHCKEAARYQSRNPDLFYSVEGFGKGIWGIKIGFPKKVTHGATYSSVKDEEKDQDYLERVDNLKVMKELTDIELEAKAPGGTKKRTISTYDRDDEVTSTALCRAEHKCEINPSHSTFQRTGSRVNYMEPHHLIPVSKRDLFEKEIDIIQNIISLCPNCHKAIHYAFHEDRVKILKQAYAIKQAGLQTKGIGITIEQLFEFYKIQKNNRA